MREEAREQKRNQKQWIDHIRCFFCNISGDPVISIYQKLTEVKNG